MPSIFPSNASSAIITANYTPRDAHPSAVSYSRQSEPTSLPYSTPVPHLSNQQSPQVRRHSYNPPNYPPQPQDPYTRTGEPRVRAQSLVANESQLGGPLPVTMDTQRLSYTQHQQQYYQQPYPQHQQRYHPFSNPNTQGHGHSSMNQSTNVSAMRQHTASSSAAAAASYQHLISSSNSYQQQQQQQQQQQRLRPIAPAPGPPPPTSSNFVPPQMRLQQQQQQQFQNNFNMSPSLHPQFRAKAVCRLTCKSCLSDVCMRGMKAILLADSRVELYSTDRPPKGVQLVYDDYRTRNCKCRIRDVACLGCGNTLGYHVTQPCESCLEACNNGHFWMFHSDGVSCTERYIPKTSSFSSSRNSNITNGNGTSNSSRANNNNSNNSNDQEQDLSFRRRTSIHDIEYNSAVNAGPQSSTRTISSSSSSSQRNSNDMEDDDDDFGSDDEDDDIEEEDDGDDDDDEGRDEEEGEIEEEKPQVMLWAALHAQEERYLQQMQQQLYYQQQQQTQYQQRLLQQQQQQNNPQGQDQQQQLQPQQLPSVGSQYHSMISTAISNASMMLWDEGKSLGLYEQLCR